ncbi:alcohol dehydrogenase catalytic domain-containing protein [Candidatus Aerophobetes bacterium]|nr:alcohol dehydrogenase catalytic domain-containing protein [Candidatus Aerophobetes bacterium]
MRAAVWYGKNDLRTEEREKPSLEDGEVLIKVKACGICGTDLMICNEKFPRSHPPLIPGHEFSGEIVEIKDVSSNLKVGDRVVANPLFFCGRCVACKMGFTNACPKLGLIGVDIDGAFAEYVKASRDKVYKIPSRFPFQNAALVEPVAVAYHAVRISGCKVGDFVVVLGAGPIGMLVAMIAKIAGASEVVLIEVAKYRLELTKKLGFSTIDASGGNVVEKIHEMTEGKGADLVFDTAAVSQTAAQFISLIRPQGKIIILGLYKQPEKVDLFNIVIKEGHILGSRVYTETDFEKAADLVTSGKIKMEPLITHHLTLEEANKGVRLLEQGKDVMKVVLFP